jgi:protein gp37
MGQQTGIEWTDHTFNPWWGCVRVSPACQHCYAETFAKRTGNAVWGVDAPRRMFGDKHWQEPAKWNRAAAAAGIRRKVFCASMADVFEDRPDLIDPRGRLFGLIEATPMLDWLLLTKRPENIRPMLDRVAGIEGDFAGLRNLSYRPNLWLGTSVENQERADARIPELLACRDLCAGTFLSCEPLLGPLDLTPWVFDRRAVVRRLMNGPLCLNRDQSDDMVATPVDWVITGGESGPGARPSNPAWFRSIRDQCAAAGVAFHHKQNGEFVDEHHPAAEGADKFDDTFVEREHQPGGGVIDYRGVFMVKVGKAKAGHLLDGREHLEFPAAMEASA